MTSDLNIEEIAERAAVRAVKTVLLQIGIDVEDPIAAQRDFFLLRELTKIAGDPEFRRDLEYLRAWRVRTEGVTVKGIGVVTTIMIGGLLTAIWIGIQNLLHRP